MSEIESASNSRDAWKRYKVVSRIKKLSALPNNISVSMLNDHFSSIFQKSDPLSLSSFDVASLPDEPLVVTDFRINFHLQRLKKGCGGPDGIPFWVFKNNSLHISCVIAYVLISV